MSGYFYAFPDAATARKKLPDYFAKDTELDAWYPTSGAMTYSARGVWLAEPVMSDPDPETGAQKVIKPGERSKPYVMLVPEKIDGASYYAIAPAGAQGFA